MPFRLVRREIMRSSCQVVKYQANPFFRYKTWVTNPKLAQEMAEKVTRRTIGVACCPVAGIPPPNEEEELPELTNELNLT